MRYRNCLTSDIEQCARVLQSAYAEAPYNEHWKISDAEAYLSRFYLFEPNLCFVAEDGKEILGALFAYSYPWHGGQQSCYIQEIFVKSGEHGKGIGKGLINQLSNAKGSGPTWLLVNENAKAVEFYQSLGFSCAGPYKFYAGKI